jgi:hypothetical protein
VIGGKDLARGHFLSNSKAVRAGGLEPPILAEPDPKSGVSANSTTRASTISFKFQVSSFKFQLWKFRDLNFIARGIFFG